MRALVPALVMVGCLGWIGAADAMTQQAADDHASHQTPAPQSPQPDPHAGHQMPAPPAAHDQHAGDPAALPAFIPRLTDADREAAFPPGLDDHAMGDEGLFSFVLFDRLEAAAGDGARGAHVEAKGWVGGDRDRLWFRAGGDAYRGERGELTGEAMYGHMFSRWWDVVAGVRQDVGGGPARTWAAFGIQGLAPYWFEVQLTGYVGPSGRTAARAEVEYELLFTNRLILQPRIEVELSGKDDPERAIGAGLSTTDIGLRLRYEIRREVAPYLGVVWQRKYFGTAAFAQAAGEHAGRTQAVAGVRLWF